MSPRSNRRARERAAKREEKRRSRLAHRAGTGAAAAVAGTALVAPAAHAATLTVSNLNDSGAGSLRQAVLDADTAGPDEIVFQSGLSGSINLTNDLDVQDGELSIQGPGASQITVNGNGTDRILDIYNFATAGEPVSISGLTFTNGGGDGDGSGGGALNNDAATLTLSGMTIRDSSALPGEYGGGVEHDVGFPLVVENSTISGNDTNVDGGGIALYNQSAALTIRNSTISGNTAGSDGGGIGVYQTVGDVLIEGTTISGNDAAGTGGGARLYNIEGNVTIRSSTVDGNTAGGTGGGVALYGVPETQATVIDSSTFAGNRADGRGGGLATFGTDGPLTVSNTTVTGNAADADNNDNGYGGGIIFYNYGDETTPRRLLNSTVVGNSAADAGGVRHDGGDQPATGTDILRISSSVIAGNSVTDSGPDIELNDPAGSFEIGHSLIQNPAGVPITEAPAGSVLTGVDPQLGPLAANGGPTQTMLPTLTSPVIDKGVGNSLASDQRGFARTVDLAANANAASGDGTDIGAVELRGASCQGQVVFAEFNSTDGNDTLTGTTGADSISGLAGNDTIRTGGGNDCANGDDGKDKLSGQGGKDSVKGGAGKDNASGGGGKDKVSGGAGKDIVKGGGGKDKLKGNAGKDKLKARGGGKDKVNCGAGKDKATVDEKDKVSANCETVDVG